MEPTITFIGKINSTLKTIEKCPLQGNENAPDAVLSIFPEFIDGIQNINVGSEILLLTWLHMGDRSVIKCRPRYNQESPLVGVFSTRSPNRPNPVGIHSVKVLSISSDGLITVSGLEALDQTPLIDIKSI